MRLCLSCRFVSPAGSLLCGRCGRSFGGRLCPRHHLSPPGSLFCVQCGKGELTDATPFFPLGWLSRALAWGIVLLLLSVVSHHAAVLFRCLWWAAFWALIHLLNICPCAVVRGMARAVSWLLALLLLSLILPSAAGSRVRAFLWGALRWTWRLTGRSFLSLLKWLHRRVEGTPDPPEKPKKKKQA